MLSRAHLKGHQPQASGIASYMGTVELGVYLALGPVQGSGQGHTQGGGDPSD